MVERLRAMGVRCDHEPQGTFYVWADIGSLPAPIDDADTFFEQALRWKVLTVPGRFFDVNPGGRRTTNSPFRHWVRFSFGPPEENVRLGLDRLAEMIGEFA